MIVLLRRSSFVSILKGSSLQNGLDPRLLNLTSGLPVYQHEIQFLRTRPAKMVIVLLVLQLCFSDWAWYKRTAEDFFPKKMQKYGLVVSVAIYFLFFLFGGLVFHFLEGSNEKESGHTYLGYNKQFLDNNTCVDPEDFARLVYKIIEAYEKGIITTNQTETIAKWDFAGSVFFSTTVVTTIGYGNITPDTIGGQVFFGFYALIGIPIFLYTTAGLSSVLNKAIARLKKKFSLFQSRPKVQVTLFNLSVVLVGLTLFLFLPSIIFHYTQDEWTFHTSVYYSFVTLTTIGFGDYVADLPSSEYGIRVLFRLFVSLWILFGLTWMGSIIALIQDLITEQSEKLENKIHTATSKHSAEGDGSHGKTTPTSETKVGDPTEEMKQNQTTVL